MRAVLIAALALMAAGCQWVPGTDDNAAEAAKSLVREELFDGGTARFENVVVTRADGQIQVCGWVNAKNRYGAYAGADRFLVIDGRVAAIGGETPPEFGSCVASNRAARERMLRDANRAMDAFERAAGSASPAR